MLRGGVNDFARGWVGGGAGVIVLGKVCRWEGQRVILLSPAYVRLLRRFVRSVQACDVSIRHAGRMHMQVFAWVPILYIISQSAAWEMTEGQLLANSNEKNKGNRQG